MQNLGANRVYYGQLENREWRSRRDNTFLDLQNSSKDTHPHSLTVKYARVICLLTKQKNLKTNRS